MPPGRAGVRAGWGLAAAVLALLLQSFFRQPVSPALYAAVLVLAGLTVWRPFYGLLVLAGIGPLAAMLMALGRGPAGNIVFGEVLTFTFLAAWAGRQAVRPEPLRPPPLVTFLAVSLAVLALASGIVHTAQILVEMQPEPSALVLGSAVRDFVLHPPGTEAMEGAAVFGCGLLLLLAAAHLAGGEPGGRRAVLRMVVCGASAAAVLNVVRLVSVALMREDVLGALWNLLLTLRVNVHYTDRNAAGSFFAMALFFSIAFVRREWLLAAFAIPATALGLWLSGSRIALASAGCALLAVALVVWSRSASRATRYAALAGLTALIAVMGAAWQFYPEGRNIRPARAFSIRVDLAHAGLAMAADHPAFGVGPGRFYMRSGDYAGESLQAMGFARENAHNNFIQIAAEFGIPAAIAFVLLLGVCLRELHRGPPEPGSRWLAGGLAAYALTFLGGHPLLVPEAAFPFWIALGLCAATVPAVRPAARPARLATAIVAVALIAAIWPRTSAAMRDANLDHVGIGLSRWQHDPGGQRYRFAGAHATFYVPTDAHSVTIPLQNAAADRRTVEVQVLVEGKEVNRILLPADDQWRPLRVPLMRKPDTAYTRFDLVTYRPGDTEPVGIDATNEGGAIRVGRPEAER